MKKFLVLLGLICVTSSVLWAQDSMAAPSSNKGNGRLVFTNTATFVPGDVLMLRADNLVYTNDDYAFRGSLRLSLSGTAEIDFGNEGHMVTELGGIQRMKTLGARLKILSDAEYHPAVALSARGTVDWLINDYSRQTVQENIGYLARKGMESFRYGFQYVTGGIIVSHRFDEIFEVTAALGIQQFQLRSTTMYLTSPAPAESFAQGSAIVRINGVNGYCGAEAMLTPRLTIAGEIEALPEPTPVVETLNFDVDRAVRLAVGFKLFPIRYIGVEGSFSELFPAVGAKSSEVRMGIELFLPILERL
jgi:hypothetical protein